MKPLWSSTEQFIFTIFHTLFGLLVNKALYLLPEANVLRVLNLNTWGLGWPISSDRKARFRALREVLAHSDYDVILLQEVWYRADHELLRSAIPHTTYFGIFNSGCSGYLLPLGCSGLTILSRYPLEEVEFTPFKVCLIGYPLGRQHF